MRNAVYVGNLASSLDAGALQRLFSSCGKMLRFTAIGHPDIVRGRGGSAVVEMECEDDAILAIRTLDGTALHGNTLVVRAATAVEETASGHPRLFSTMNMADDAEPPTNV
jgi:RNA recognition motif-containing protein